MTQTNKIVILEKQARQSILTGLLKQQSAISDVSFVSLNVFMNSFVKDERNNDWFKAVSLLEEVANQYDVLKTILRFPVTAQTLLSFIDTMADEGWTVKDLPVRNEKEEQLKEVIEYLIKQGFDRRFRQWAMIESSPDLSDVSIYQNFYDYPISKRIPNLQNKGLKEVRIPLNDPSVKAYYANNPRSEAQACVQMLLSDPMPYDQQVIVCMDPNLEAQLESFLIQYQIPYFRVNERKTTLAFRLIQDLLNLVQDKSNKNLIRLIQNDLIKMDDRISTIKYLETFGFDLNEVLKPLTHVKTQIETTTVKSTLGGDRGTAPFERLEKKAEKSLSAVRSQLTQLDSLDSDHFEIFIPQLFDVFLSFFDGFTDEDIESINKIKSVFENAYPYLKTMKDPYPVLSFALSNLKLSNPQTSGLILTDIKHSMIPNKKRIFLLSCTQEFYPQVPVNSGLFDDDYRQSISDDLTLRFDYHKNNLEALKTMYEETVYSYHLSGYDGKKKGFPNELSVYFGGSQNEGIAQRWKLIEKNLPLKKHKIDFSTKFSKDLFIKNDEIYGSITSFERFFKCSYQYFLYSGIGLRRPDTYEIDAARLGSLIHRVLELGIEKHSKNYAQALFGNEKSALQPLFDDLMRFYPKRQNEIRLMMDRTEILLKLCLEFMISREEHSEFKPYAVEKDFNLLIDLGRKYKLHLTGAIDRIDKVEDGFMILDYKSSVHKINENEVMLGLQLQLCTYMWVCDQYLDFGQPYGMYYVNFGQKNTALTAWKYDGNARMVVKDDDAQSQWFKTKKLEGWTTTELRIIPDGKKKRVDDSDFLKIDDNASHVNGHSINKGGSYGVKFHYDPNKIEEHMMDIYGQMIDSMENAEIKKTNVARSCEFCEFSHFCQFKEEPKKLKAVKKDDSELRAKR